MMLNSEQWVGVGIGAFLILIGVVILSVSLSHGQEQQRSATSYKLQLEYVTKQRQQCEINLADLWEQAELLALKNRDLEKELKKVKDEAVSDSYKGSTE